MQYSCKISECQGVHNREHDISGSGCVVALWDRLVFSTDVKGSLRTASPPRVEKQAINTERESKQEPDGVHREPHSTCM